MKKAILPALFLVAILAACSDKKAEGIITYNLTYILPDSLRNYGSYLPTSATVYFKGDSVATVQGSDEESTTMITHRPSGYMEALLKSGIRKFAVEYAKSEQAAELPDLSIYDITKATGQKTIAGFKADRYTRKDKFTGDTTSLWFTQELKVPANFLTMAFKPELGMPVVFSTNQNGFITRVELKEVKYQPVPAGIFSTPPGYQKLTPQQLRDMPVEN